MSFAQPLMLLGLLGATLPILIHLINRRRPRKQPFPAMQLLLQSVQRVERRWRIRRFVLLAMRVLLLAALALAAARPLLGTDQGRGEGLSRQGPERLALVIDASLSMRARFDGRSSFSRAVDRARGWIERLGPEDQALLVFTGSPPRIPIARPTADRGRLMGTLVDASPGWRPDRLAEAVTVAAESLGRQETEEEAGPLPPARVVVFSDLARPAFEGAASLLVPGSDRPAALEVVDVLAGVPPETRRNYAIVGARAEVVPGEVARTIQTEVRIQSYDMEAEAEARPRVVRLVEGDRVLEEGTAEVAAAALTQKSLPHPFEADGYHSVQVELEPDTLREDDVFFLPVEVTKRIRVLLVDGDPSGVAKEDEVFYFERAFRAGASDQPAPVTVSSDDLSRTDLEPYDVVVLAGVPTLSRVEAERIVRFVENGGGLLITVAEGLDLGAYATGLGPVLPRELRGFKTQRRKALRFDKPKLDHPVLEIFGGEALEGLLSTQTKTFMLLQPGKVPMKTLLSFEGGAPALVVHETQKGKVALLTTSIDRDLSDLPIRPSFVPLVRQLVLFLGDAIHESRLSRTSVGEAVDLEVPPGATQLEIVAPSGAATVFRQPELASAGEAVRFSATDVPGHYRARAAFGGELVDLDRASFAVNVDPVESDLRPFEVAEAEAILRGETAVSETEPSTAGTRRTRRLDARTLAGILLLMMGLAFVVESALTAVRTGR